MITIEQALAAKHGQQFYRADITNADGAPLRCRVNGKCITWKTRPGEFILPMKHGLHTCFYITNTSHPLKGGGTQQANAHRWFTSTAEAELHRNVDNR